MRFLCRACTRRGGLRLNWALAMTSGRWERKAERQRTEDRATEARATRSQSHRGRDHHDIALCPSAALSSAALFRGLTPPARLGSFQMNSIPLAMTWEFWSRQRWQLLLAWTAMAAVPTLVFASLWYGG